MLPGKKRAAVEMGSTAHPYAAQRQEQILKEIKAEAEALCRLYGKSLEEMTERFLNGRFSISFSGLKWIEYFCYD
eukprot:g9749.t1